MPDDITFTLTGASGGLRFGVEEPVAVDHKKIGRLARKLFYMAEELRELGCTVRVDVVFPPPPGATAVLPMGSTHATAPPPSQPPSSGTMHKGS